MRDYLLNYARPLIYTTSLSNANIVAAECSFDMLEEGEAQKVRTLVLYTTDALTPQQLSTQLLSLCAHLTTSFAAQLTARRIPASLLSVPTELSELPTPIIPVLTPHPRPLSAHLRVRGLNARPITWPTVPKGADRVRICLHSQNSVEEVDRLVSAMIEWAESWQAAQDAVQREKGDASAVVVAQAKL